MFYRALMIVALVFALLGGPVAAQEAQVQDEAAKDFLDKKSAWAVKLGWHLAETSAYADYWNLSAGDMSGPALEVGYEYRFYRWLALEVPLGFRYATRTVPFGDPALSTRTERFTQFTLWLSPSAKFYAPVGDKFGVYAGLGPDILYTSNDFSTNDKLGSSEAGFGFHGMAGGEYIVQQIRKTGSYISIGLEYKYTKVTIKEADETEIRRLNLTKGTGLAPHDWDIGGHTFMAGVRYHY
jgi:opacity protein-like surface antigen